MSLVRASLGDDLRVECEDVTTGDRFVTDAPQSVGGLQEKVSPTDQFVAALGACILVMMGMKARRLKFDLRGATIEIEKELAYKPVMRISKLAITVRVPHEADAEVKAQIEEVARHCPIHTSLREEIEQSMSFVWGN